MIKFTCVKGKNEKVFVKISNITTSEDIKIHDFIKTVLYRKEYKPFIQAFNKNIEASYLFYDVLFPVQFWYDVKTQVKRLFEVDLKLENEQICLNTEINENIFQHFIDSLKLPEKYDTKSETYKYQRDSVLKGLQNKIGRIEIGTSGGKTFITYLYCKYALEYIATNKNEKVLIIVPSKLLAKQLKDDFAEYQSLEENKLNIETIFAGSKKVLDANIVCGTYQSLSNYEKEYFDDFRFIICDELHRAKAYSIKKDIYDKITKADFFFGMTGTFPKYNTLDYLHIVSMFGGLLEEKTVRSLIDDGVSVPVKINVIKINYGKNTFSKDLKDSGVIGTEKYRAEKSYFQNLKERNLIITKLLNHYKSNSLLLVDTIDYCYLLYDMFSKVFADDKSRQIEIINGSVSNRDEIIKKMKETESGFILIGTYGTMSTGANIPNISHIYFVDGGKSEIRIRQSIGRGIRLSEGKTKCVIFDFYDDLMGSSFKNHAKERIAIYKEQKLDYKITEVNIVT